MKDGLVDRVKHWKGFSSYAQLATGEVEKFHYVDWTAWHRAGGLKSKKKPEAFIKTVTVELTPLPAWEHMPPHKRQAYFRREVRKLEQEFRELRKNAGRPAMSKQKLETIDPRDRPKTPAANTRAPLCHASTIEAVEQYKEDLIEFLDKYWYASDMWQRGVYEVAFPSGSYRPPDIRSAT